MMSTKRPYIFKCPKCGQTENILDYGNYIDWFTADEDELPTSYIESYGCPICNITWDVEYEMSYKIKNITDYEEQTNKKG